MKKNYYLIVITLLLGVYSEPSLAKDITRSPAYLMADEYHQYWSDLYLLKSQLILEPSHPIAYDDPNNGPLVKSVLDKNRSSAAVKTYLDGFLKGPPQDRIDVLLIPIVGLYIDSFVTFGPKYENEYLDATQLMIVFLQEYVKFRKTVAERASGSSVEIMMNLLKSTEQDLDWKKKKYADALRMQITQNKFTPGGAQRALKMAQDLEQDH